MPVAIQHKHSRRLAVCQNKDVCPPEMAPDGTKLVPSCTHESLQPQPGEAAKRFGCICAGIPGDTFVKNICEQQQPYTNWLFEMRPDSKGDSLMNKTGFGMWMYERAGVPANVRHRATAICTAATP
jgi:hypothetical protein